MAAVCGFVIKVKNLEKCRAFYRDILLLGDPITDSNFRTEFELKGGSRLTLLHVREEESIRQGTGMAFWLMPDNPEVLEENLAECGCLPVSDELNLCDPDVKSFHDPENNLFYIASKS